MPDPVYEPREERSPAGGRASTGPRPTPETAEGPAEDAARGRMALTRLAEAERELALARRHQEAKVAELEDRLAWIEEHELDLRDAAERRPWLGALLRAWAGSVKIARRGARFLHR